MNRTKAQFARLLELDSRIRSGGYPNCVTFAADYEVSQKTVQRDIDYLRDQLGAPIEYDRARKGFYYTDRNWFLPAISLSEGDLMALLVAARALEAYRGAPVAKDLERVFGKLVSLLHEKMSFQPELLYSKFTFTSPPAKPIDGKVWVQVVRALTALRCLEISYRPLGCPKARKHIVEPYHVANLAGEWYLFAKSRKTGKIIQFSIPRITGAEIAEESFRMPAGFDARKFFENAFGRFVMARTTYHVALVFDGKVADWVLERRWHPRQTIRRLKDGNIELSFRAGGLYEIFRWVMAWGRHCRVVSPPELRKMVADEVQAMARYGTR